MNKNTKKSNISPSTKNNKGKLKIDINCCHTDKVPYLDEDDKIIFALGIIFIDYILQISIVRLRKKKNYEK